MSTKDPKKKTTRKAKALAKPAMDPLLGEKILILLHQILEQLKLQNEYIQDHEKDDTPEMTELERGAFEKELAEAQRDITDIISPLDPIEHEIDRDEAGY